MARIRRTDQMATVKPVGDVLRFKMKSRLLRMGTADERCGQIPATFIRHNSPYPNWICGKDGAGPREAGKNTKQ